MKMMFEAEHVMTCTLLLLTLFFLELTTGQTGSRKTWWRKTNLTGVSFYGYKAVFENSTTIRCAGHCSSNLPCSSFSTHPATRRCFIFEKRMAFGVNMQRDVGYKHYWTLSEICPANKGYTYNASAHVCYRGELLNRIPWNESQVKCQDEGGHLYIADNKDKLDIVTQYVYDNGLLNMGVKLGANDLFEEGWWRWLDGSAVAPAMWYLAQPDNRDGIQHCMEPTRGHPDYLSDGICTSTERFMCEISML